VNNIPLRKSRWGAYVVANSDETRQAGPYVPKVLPDQKKMVLRGWPVAQSGPLKTSHTGVGQVDPEEKIKRKASKTLWRGAARGCGQRL